MTDEQAVPLTPSEETQQPRTTCGFCGHESHKRWCGDCSDGPCRRATQADYDVAADYDRPATAGRHRTQEQAVPLTSIQTTLERLGRGVTRATNDDGTIEARTVHLFIADLLVEAEAYKAGRDGLVEKVLALREVYSAGLEYVSRAAVLHLLATPSDTPKEPTYTEVHTTACHAGMDGDCSWSECPQLRDGEPIKSGRHCPLDSVSTEGWTRATPKPT